MSRPTGRVLTLLELLQSGGTRTIADLAERLGVDGRTVRRYVDHLIDLDVPVEAVRGRYGGYRLGPGHRLPPLMLGEDEAVAVLLGLVAGRRTGLTTATATAGETAAAKIRRVLPRPLAARVDAVLEALAFTEPAGESAAPDAGILLTLADAVRHRRPVAIRYTDREGRRGDRTLHPQGVVAHAGRWYVTGRDPGIGEDRTFRLDRVADARLLPGSFEAIEGPDPARRVLSGFATAPYRHEVTLRIRGTAEQIRTRLPASVASVTALPGTGPPSPAPEPADAREPDRSDTSEASEASDGPPWLRVEVRAERLDWLPPVLAALDLPFVVERPDELRELVVALADRFARRARRS
ncbi:helix-turn-helix transcriptional regulator [Streptomyces sp. NBC_01428]|uniref:helix-turn-helix transcriptional regulator n=1 Tax=Streptomyces sp. NBC_01428 TaxID=2903861 RepID=UPI002E2F6016|nr:WYL domain-containing protein [Streptomyces sp. NBC_01428]